MLIVAEHVARECQDGCDTRINDALHGALLLAKVGVRDVATLEAALLVVGTNLDADAALRPPGDSPPNAQLKRIRMCFGIEVEEIVTALAAIGAATGKELRQLPHKAKQVCLAEHLHGLRKAQLNGIADLESDHTFRSLLKRTLEIRQELAGTHAGLEAAIDEVVSGRVRMADGQLVPVKLCV
mmetsp:Transcript_56378/g.157088  ORF Transcript_56378/g.157088 Transcript_56378/m.157088 type:complete len:183 (-) Transcript_56378:84-632(-)